MIKYLLQMMQNDGQKTIWLFLDRNDWPRQYVSFLERKGFKVELFQRPSACLQRVRRGMGSCEVVVIHKDLGVHVPEEWKTGIGSTEVVREIRETAPYVRIGILSGEYPDGEDHVKRIGADFYFSPLENMDDWTLDQFRKGYLLPAEQEQRGKYVEKPPTSDYFRGYGLERG